MLFRRNEYFNKVCFIYIKIHKFRILRYLYVGLKLYKMVSSVHLVNINIKIISHLYGIEFVYKDKYVCFYFQYFK